MSVNRPVAVTTGPQGFIRRWDHAGASPTVAALAGRWIDLERGVMVRLDGKPPRKVIVVPDRLVNLVA